MKYFIVLALCLSAVVAEDVHERGDNFLSLHYSQHQQTLEEAKRNLANAYGGRQVEFGSYGGANGVGTIGFTSSGQHQQTVEGGRRNFEEVGSYGGVNGVGTIGFTSSGQHEQTVAGSRRNFEEVGSYGGVGTIGLTSTGSSGSIHTLTSGSNAELSSAANSNIENTHSVNVASVSTGGSSSHLARGTHATGSDYYDVSIGQNGQQIAHESGSNRVVGCHQDSQGTTNVLFRSGVNGIAGCQNSQLRGSQGTANVIYGFPAVSSDKHFRNEENYVSNIGYPVVYTIPSGSVSEDHVVHNRKHVQTVNLPIAQFPRSKILVGSAADHVDFNAKYQNDVVTAGNTNSLFNSGFRTVNQADSGFRTGQQTRLGVNSGYSGATSVNSNSDTRSTFNSGFSSGGSISNVGLDNYMQEVRDIAKVQSQGAFVDGTYAGNRQHNAHVESGHAGGFYNGVAGVGVTSVGVGAGTTGYKTKSWEKASKWSSQSEFGSDGKVNDFKELSTGESENYDINGHRAGYKAATSTLSDNGLVSSYSQHT